MKTKRNTVIGIAVATVLSAAVATGVYAHGGGYGPGYGQVMGGPGMMGPGMMQGHGHMMGGMGQMGPGMMGGRGGMMAPGMMGGPGGMMFGDHAAFAEQRLENFKSQLGITAEQETTWNTFADTFRAHAQYMNERHRAQAGPGKNQGFTEHFAQMQAGMAQMEAIAKSAQDLYASLTPEQKARADSLTAGNCWR